VSPLKLKVGLHWFHVASHTIFSDVVSPTIVLINPSMITDVGQLNCVSLKTRKLLNLFNVLSFRFSRDCEIPT